jgi:hypothetical protein
VAQGTAAGKSSISAGSRQLGGVGEVEEHQSACADPRGSSVEDGRRRGGLTPASSRSGQEMAAGASHRGGKEERRSRALWSSYSSGEQGGALARAARAAGSQQRQDAGAARQGI